MDTGPSPAFFRAHLEEAQHSGLSTGLLFPQLSSLMDTSTSPTLFRAHLEAAGNSGQSARLLLLPQHNPVDTSPSPLLFLRVWERRRERCWGKMGNRERRGCGAAAVPGALWRMVTFQRRNGNREPLVRLHRTKRLLWGSVMLQRCPRPDGGGSTSIGSASGGGSTSMGEMPSSGGSISIGSIWLLLL